MNHSIKVFGAEEHNLKNIDVEIPRDKLVVITGLSGSGKSSLAFDTIYAEGQRRYVESLSAYARQFLGLMNKPKVELIEGLSPAISIDQKSSSRNPRSTVGTVTEIYDYLRLLFARLGTPIDPKTGEALKRQSIDEILDEILRSYQDKRVMILSPLVDHRKGEFKKLFATIKDQGFTRVKIDGELYRLDEPLPDLDRHVKHTVKVVVDRMSVNSDKSSRLADSVELALELSKGYLGVEDLETGEERRFSEHICMSDGSFFPELEPRLFSFNSPQGACEVCNGLGDINSVQPDLLISDENLSLHQGVLEAWGGRRRSMRMSPGVAWFWRNLDKGLKKYKIDRKMPWKELPKEHQDLVLYGDGLALEGAIPTLERHYLKTTSESFRRKIEQYMREAPCLSCQGARLRKEVRWVKFRGRSIDEICALNIESCLEFFQSLELNDQERQIAEQVLKEIVERLYFLHNVGLRYLSLDRSANTLSGGESQRIRLATQIGSGLMGVLYILDEPSIGLHQRDNQKLLSTLHRLRDLGNTVLVVEHDEDTIRQSDYVVDIGPRAGRDGGKVVACGTPEEVEKSSSLTAQYLNGTLEIEVPEVRRDAGDRYANWIKVKGARKNNLKELHCRIPLSRLTCVTGVSGSGKSSLVNEVILPAIRAELRGTELPRSEKFFEKVEFYGSDLNKVIEIDQSPIGRTPRSNPATYIGAFDEIRKVFANTASARKRGYSQGRFSFNVKGGRCESCQGQGINKIEMHFLPDVYVQCEICEGQRYNRETLQVTYQGKTIAQVLESTAIEALELFKNHPKISRYLQTLVDVGLSYVQLGQSATTLSGGEAQRMKLAKELSKRATGKTLYILDEPTTGLHFHDVHSLLKVLQRLVEAGNTMIVIEHNLDVIKSADYLLDLGPEGGDEGGELVACGTPEEVAEVEASFTGQYLAKMLPTFASRA